MMRSPLRLPGAAALFCAALAALSCYGPGFEPDALTSVSLDRDALRLAPGASAYVVLTARPNSLASGLRAVWTSSSDEIAVLGPDGLDEDETAIGEDGTARMRIALCEDWAIGKGDRASVSVALFGEGGEPARDGSGRALSASLIVFAGEPEGGAGLLSDVRIDENAPLGMSPGQTARFDAETYPPSVAARLRWTSSDPRVATVEWDPPGLKATVTAISPGRTTITVITADDGRRWGRHSVTVN